ncbi:branched-chain amino acid ABC transporter permease [Hydrogenophaga sp.]|uniref:branched-chain amino acid ABC transporter permease n=1 Tax=Hydrogenophaga sp. TaxID=1904254 RepID=UPI0039190DD2
MDGWIVSLLNGLSYGLLLFLLSAGLTLIFSLMGVLNFAHASFYMLGAYLGHSLTQALGFGWALLVAPLLVGLLGVAFERWVLRRVHAHGHVAELLVTFGLSYVVLELVRLLWGLGPIHNPVPDALAGPLFTVGGMPFSRYRAFMAGASLLVLGALAWALVRTRLGLIVRAALTHPDTVQTLGHDVPRVFMGVFGAGAALAALAGVIGGVAFVTEPGMAATVGSVLFVVVVVGGLGSLAGAFWASLFIGTLQTLAVGIDLPLGELLGRQGVAEHPLRRLTVSQLAPVLPYALLVLVLIVRPNGWLGRSEDRA